MTAGVKTRLRKNSLQPLSSWLKLSGKNLRKARKLAWRPRKKIIQLLQTKWNCAWSGLSTLCIIFRYAWSLEELNSLQRGLPHMTFALEGGGESKRSRRSVGGCMNCTVYFSFKMQIRGSGFKNPKKSRRHMWKAGSPQSWREGEPAWMISNEGKPSDRMRKGQPCHYEKATALK